VHPYYPRCFPAGQLEFITTSTYWRTPLFRSERFCQEFVATLNAVRSEFAFLLIGWVLMPEHFHVLLKPEPADLTPKIVKQLKQRTASHILGALREHEQHPWSDRMLRALRLPDDGALQGAASSLGKALLSLQCVQRAEAAGETGLHARQSGKARAGFFAGGLALVEFQILLPE